MKRCKVFKMKRLECAKILTKECANVHSMKNKGYANCAKLQTLGPRDKSEMNYTINEDPTECTENI